MTKQANLERLLEMRANDFSDLMTERFGLRRKLKDARCEIASLTNDIGNIQRRIAECDGDYLAHRRIVQIGRGV